MSDNIVVVKNKKTNLFWYGFSKGDEFKQRNFDIGFDEDYGDVTFDKATWYDLSIQSEHDYVINNITDDYEIIIVVLSKTDPNISNFSF